MCRIIGSSTTGKVVLIVLDGVGIGELPDASRYGDKGSSTLFHTARAVGGLHLPTLASLGLGRIGVIPGVPPDPRPAASFGRMAEMSGGKDSTTGHWEIAGLIVEEGFPTFPHGFPATLMRQFVGSTGVAGWLGNMTASGTEIVERLGDEHVRTGFPIVYTSADSVFQIAAHEETFGLDRLYEVCRKTRQQVCVGKYSVGRVIARPFVGTSGSYRRTTNRRDFSMEPFGPTLLDRLSEVGVRTVGVGKIDDLFAGRGLSESYHTTTNAEGLKRITQEAEGMGEGLILANLGDFDTLYGHRNDPAGFARALESFDDALPDVMETLRAGDVLVLTADHGNDPVTPSTDHSREYVPLLWYQRGGRAGVDLGVRSTYADLGKTVLDYFGVDGTLAGRSFINEVTG